MPDFQAKSVSKNPDPRGKYLFSPKQSDYEKAENILTPPGWPYLNDPNKVNRKMKAPKPTRKNKQPRHEVEKPARPHSSEETATQDEQDKQNKKQPSAKLQRNRNTQNKKKHEHKTDRISKMLAQETSWTERRLFTKHQNNDITTNKKQQRVPYSLKTYSTYI